MNKDKKQMTERILNHALEIIYLLTGEDYVVVKKNGEQVPEGFSKAHRSLIERQTDSRERKDGKMLMTEKIVEHASKIIHLLTGELFLKEWEFLEGHKEVYKYMMMENHHTLSSLGTGFLHADPEMMSGIQKEESCGSDHQNIQEKEIHEDGSSDCETRIEVKEEFRNVHPSKEWLTKEKVPKKLKLNKMKNAPKKSLEKLSYDRQSLSHENYSSSRIEAQCLSDLNDIDEKADTTQKHIKEEEKKSIKLESVVKKPVDAAQQKDDVDQKDYVCSKSGKIIASSSHFVIRQKTHTEERAHVCGECGKSFTRSLHLTIHQRTHTGERPYECNECGKSFTSSSHLVSHQKTHTGERPFVCTDCGKSYTRRSNLVSHQRTHTGERPYVCSECGKSFTHRSHYVDHQKIHTGEGTHVCSDCGKSFTRSLHLAIHQRSHTGERPYACSECGKSFVCSSHLVSHQLIHTGEKPYACPECGKRFTYRSNLVNHQKTHTE